MDFQLVSLHLFTANRHLCHTSGSHLSALGRYDRGITVTFGTTWQSLIRQNLANTQSLSPCFSSGVCVGAAALKSLVFLLGFRAKEFLHHQLRSASYQTLYGDSLDLGQLKRKDILPLKRSPKITTQFIPVYLLDAEHCCQEDVNMLDYYLLFEDSVILPGVCIVTTKNISLVAQPHQLCCISIPACGVEVLSWGHVYFWAGLGSTLLTYDMMQN